MSTSTPQGKDEKGAMAGTTVEPSKTIHGEITLDLSAAAGLAAEQRQEDDQEDVGQEEDKKALASSCMPSFGHSFLQFWRGPHLKHLNEDTFTLTQGVHSLNERQLLARET